MAGVLEQEEIDALMGGLEAGDVETAGEVTAPSARYDFSRHHYALQRLLPHLREVFTLYAESIQERITALSSSTNHVEVDELLVTDIDELSPRLALPCRIAVLDAAPIARPMLLAVESDLVFDIVNRYFGGGSSLRKTRATEKFSSTELKLSELFVEDLVSDIAASWHTLLEISPRISGWESDLHHIDQLDDHEALVAVRFKVVFDGSEGGVWLLVPWLGLEPLKDQLHSSDQEHPQLPDARWSECFLEGLEDAPVEVIAVLAEQKIKLKHALQLKTGDVIAINEPSEIDLKIGGIRLLRARFGTHEGQMAAQILETLRSPMPKTSR